MEIGFIGLGIMGSRMASNLQRRGHDLIVYNRTRHKADPLIEGGAIWASSPAELGQQVKIVITMLANPDAVSQVALGQAGFLQHLVPGSLWMDCSTVNPSFSKEMAAQAREKWVHFVDAPVAGTSGPAAAGDLLFLVGGEQADIETLRPLFDAMGRKVIHVGGNGMGTSLKMVFNLMLGEAMLAFSEGMLLGESLGIDREKLLSVLVESAVAAPFAAGKRRKLQSADWAAEFPMKWMHKDLRLAALTGSEQGVPLPGVEAAGEVFGLAAEDGFADDDFSAIYQFLADQTRSHQP